MATQHRLLVSLLELLLAPVALGLDRRVLLVDGPPPVIGVVDLVQSRLQRRDLRLGLRVVLEVVNDLLDLGDASISRSRAPSWWEASFESYVPPGAGRTRNQTPSSG